MSIVTVLGEITRGELDFCQSHEHLFIANGYPAAVNPSQRIDDCVLSATELTAYRKAGGCAVVDAQPIGCGRGVNELARVSRESGAHIIASTGFHRMAFYPENHWIYTYSADKLTELFVSELTCGMYADYFGEPEQDEQTGYRAGQIKCALDSGAFSKQYQKLFSAAAEASKLTGAPLMVHIEAGSDPSSLADFLYGAGVDLNRAAFCHMDRSVRDLDVHRELCGRGIYMEYDTVARPKYHDDAREAEIILEMLDAGFGDRLLMSLDTTRDRLLSYGGKTGLCYILEQFIPMLKLRGMSAMQVDDIFITNPARLFDIKLNEIKKGAHI